MSNDNGIDRHFFVEFNQIEECEDFVEKYQDYEFDGMSMMIKQLTDSDVLSNSRKYMVTITNLTSESTPSNNVREIRQFLTSNIGPIITLKPFQNGDSLNVNVVFLNPDDSIKAITNDDVFSPNVKRVYTRTTIRMYNLQPNITEDEIINYFPDEFKPVSVTIYNMEQEHCWWARVTFNQSNIEDVFKANEFFKKSDRKPIGVLIPFGYIPYSGIDKDRFSAYKKLAMENINDNAIKIKETVGIKMDDVLSFLIRNNLNDVTFLDPKLVKIKVDENNKRYKNYKNDFVIGKEKVENDDYNDLIFVNRNANEITIPLFIKRILPHSMSNSLIERIIIPQKVTEIHHHSFFNCCFLEKIEFSQNSEFRVFKRKSFKNTRIKRIVIPSTVVEIEEGSLLNLIDVKLMDENKNYKNFDGVFY